MPGGSCFVVAIGASTEQAQLAVADEVVRIVKTLKDTGEIIQSYTPLVRD